MSSRGLDIRLKVESPDIINLENTFKEMGWGDKKKILNAAFRKAVKPTIDYAKSIVSVGTGNLQRSIGSVVPRKEVGIYIGTRRRKPWKGFHGHLVESGTVERYYTPEKTQRHPILKGRNVVGWVTEVAGRTYKRGRMDASKSYGYFMQRAVDATGNQALNILADEWYVAIAKYHRKNNIK